MHIGLIESVIVLQSRRSQESYYVVSVEMEESINKLNNIIQILCEFVRECDNRFVYERSIPTLFRMSYGHTTDLCLESIAKQFNENEHFPIFANNSIQLYKGILHKGDEFTIQCFDSNNHKYASVYVTSSIPYFNKLSETVDIFSTNYFDVSMRAGIFIRKNYELSVAYTSSRDIYLWLKDRKPSTAPNFVQSYHTLTFPRMVDRSHQGIYTLNVIQPYLSKTFVFTLNVTVLDTPEIVHGYELPPVSYIRSKQPLQLSTRLHGHFIESGIDINNMKISTKNETEMSKDLALVKNKYPYLKSMKLSVDTRLFNDTTEFSYKSTDIDGLWFKKGSSHRIAFNAMNTVGSLKETTLVKVIGFHETMKKCPALLIEKLFKQALNTKFDFSLKFPTKVPTRRMPISVMLFVNSMPLDQPSPVKVSQISERPCENELIISSRCLTARGTLLDRPLSSHRRSYTRYSDSQGEELEYDDAHALHFAIKRLSAFDCCHYLRSLVLWNSLLLHASVQNMAVFHEEVVANTFPVPVIYTVTRWSENHHSHVSSLPFNAGPWPLLFGEGTVDSTGAQRFTHNAFLNRFCRPVSVLNHSHSGKSRGISMCIVDLVNSFNSCGPWTSFISQSLCDLLYQLFSPTVTADKVDTRPTAAATVKQPTHTISRVMDPKSLLCEFCFVSVAIGVPRLVSRSTAGRHIGPIIFYRSFPGSTITVFFIVFFLFLGVIKRIKCDCLHGRVVCAGSCATLTSARLCLGCALPSRGAVRRFGSVVSSAFSTYVVPAVLSLFEQRPHFVQSIPSSLHPSVLSLPHDVPISCTPSSSTSSSFSSIPILIFVQFSMETFQVSVLPNNTISVIRRALQSLLQSRSVSSNTFPQLRLTFQNILLLDNLTISHYSILPGSTIRSSFQLLGGSDSGSEEVEDLKNTADEKTEIHIKSKSPTVDTNNSLHRPNAMFSAKPTKFFLDDMQSPETWLLTLETTYGDRGLVTSRDKFNFLLPLVPVNYVSKLSSTVKLTTAVSYKKPYEKFREAFEQLLQPSKSDLFSKYFRDQTLGDLLPSKFLSKCTSDLDAIQKGASGDEAMLRRFFLSALPMQHRQILSVIGTASLKDIALSADRLAEIAQPHLSASVEVLPFQTQGASAPNFDTAGLIAALTTLTKQNADLSQRISGLEAGLGRRYDNDRPAWNSNRAQSPSRGNSLSRDRSPSPSSQRQPMLCKYHFRFGDKAQYCHLGCQYPNIASTCKRHDVCVYHARFRQYARNCVSGCMFGTKPDTTASSSPEPKNT